MKRWLCMLLLATSAPARAADDEEPALAEQPSREAEDQAETEPPRVVAPVAERTFAEYPPEGKGSAVVTLELVVDETGRVIEADVVRGKPPFSDAALAASRSWKFKPATRGGVPIAARIRFQVRFERQVQTEPGPPAPLAPTPQAPNAEEPIEIEVLGELPDPATTSFTRVETRQLPGAFDDPLRTVDMMPGVTPIVSALPMFFVRGSPPGNVGFFIDGVRIPLLYHVFLGPSVVHPALIESVNLYSGAYPARFGRFAGAVVSADLAEPERRWRGEGSVRLLDSGAWVEAPFANGSGNAMLGGRYSYTGLIVSALTENTLRYWDYQGLVSYDLGAHDTLSLFAFGALDYLEAGNEEDVGGTSFHRLDLRLDHEFSSRTQARVAATWGADKTESGVGFVSDRMLAGRATLEHRASEQATFRTGFDVVQDSYRLMLEPATTERIIYTTLFPPRDDLATGAFADVVVSPEPWFSFTPGVRVDLFRSLGTSRVGVDPRLSADFHVTKTTRLFHAVGMAHQTPNFVPAIPGAQVAGLGHGLQRSVQATSGVEFQAPLEIDTTVAYFQNVSFDLTDPVGLNQDFDIDETSADTRATGHSYGLELHMRRPLSKRLGGVLSYTLSRTTRTHGRIKTLSAYDRTHVLNTALSYDLGHDWRAGARLAFASGIPGGRDTQDGKVYDAGRSRPFFRTDVKLTKRWWLSPTAWWGLSAEVLNANAGTEVSRRTCNPGGCKESAPPPLILPSVGVEGAF